MVSERELSDGEAMRELIWVIDRMDELASAPEPPCPVDSAELICRNLDALAYAYRLSTTLATSLIGRDGSGRAELLGFQVLGMGREQRDFLVSLLDVDQLAELERRLAGER